MTGKTEFAERIARIEAKSAGTITASARRASRAQTATTSRPRLIVALFGLFAMTAGAVVAMQEMDVTLPAAGLSDGTLLEEIVLSQLSQAQDDPQATDG